MIVRLPCCPLIADPSMRYPYLTSLAVPPLVFGSSLLCRHPKMCPTSCAKVRGSPALAQPVGVVGGRYAVLSSLFDPVQARPATWEVPW